MSKPFLTLVDSDPSPEETPRAAKDAQRASALQELFDRARNGDIPRSRPLRANEPNTLNERHLQAIMMRCMGMKQTDIAKTLNWSDATVSICLNHPDAAFIIDQIHAFSGVDVSDIQGRLKRLSSKAVDSIEAVFDADEDDPKLVQARVSKARMGFALLEHTGHGAEQKVSHTHEHAVVIDGAAGSLLSRALRESREIPATEYTVDPPTTIAPGGGVKGSGPPTALPSGTEAPPLGVPQEHPSHLN